MQTKRWADSEQNAGFRGGAECFGLVPETVPVPRTRIVQDAPVAVIRIPKFGREKCRDLATELSEVMGPPRTGLSSLIVFAAAALGGSFRQSDERKSVPGNQGWSTRKIFFINTL
jgi:hypothetical protein